jgi:acyl carrier protein
MEIMGKVRKYIVNYVNNLKPQVYSLEEQTECNLVDDGYLDSLDFINLIGAIEIEFSVEIDLGDYDPEVFTTLSGLVEAVEASGLKMGDVVNE